MKEHSCQGKILTSTNLDHLQFFVKGTRPIGVKWLDELLWQTNNTTIPQIIKNSWINDQVEKSQEWISDLLVILKPTQKVNNLISNSQNYKEGQNAIKGAM